MKIVKKALMQAFYSRANDGSNDDQVLIKERLLYEDGTEKSRLVKRNNYTRPYWITKEWYQETHEQKKEYEKLDNLNPYFSTQAKLARSVSGKLRSFDDYPTMRNLSASPYLYGTDISSVSYLKHEYKMQYPKYTPTASVAMLDLETNVFTEAGEIISGAITYKDKVLIVVDKKFIEGIDNFQDKIHDMFNKHLGKYVVERNLRLIVHVADDELGIVKRLFQMLHKLKPDFVGIWNMSFDLGKILACLERFNVDPANIFSDPSVEPRFRNFRYREDQARKVTSNGKATAKHFADLWHYIDAPSSFYIVDAMCLFKRIRAAAAARHSYGLDAILKEEVDIEKLKFDEAKGYKGIELHKFMQTNYKLEYLVYNAFDCMSMEILDEKVKDISTTMLGVTGVTELKDMSSGPKNLINALHFFMLEHGLVIGSTSEDMREPDDDLLLDLTGWITTAPCGLIDHNSKDVVEDVYELYSRIYRHCMDVDVASGYPTGEIIMNASKATTYAEIYGIRGLSEHEQREAGINMTAIRTNALTLGTTLYGLPQLDELLETFNSYHGLQ